MTLRKEEGPISNGGRSIFSIHFCLWTFVTKQILADGVVDNVHRRTSIRSKQPCNDIQYDGLASTLQRLAENFDHDSIIRGQRARLRDFD